MFDIELAVQITPNVVCIYYQSRVEAIGHRHFERWVRTLILEIKVHRGIYRPILTALFAFIDWKSPRVTFRSLGISRNSI